MEGEQTKKVNLEDLPKEELIKRCKNLLSIAQKAKSSKDALIEEVEALKTKIVKTEEATRDIVDSLTQQKLSLVTEVEEFKKLHHGGLVRINELETKVESLNRQNVRLTEENEQLICDLEALEKQGLQQQSQLLELEKTKDVDKINELQSMLSISLEEVKKVHGENKKLLESIDNLKISLSEKDKSILVISQELQVKCDTIEALKRELESMEKSEVNLKLREKLRQYHGKLVQFAGQIKALKNDKYDILRLFMLYTDQVKNWGDQLNEVAKKLPRLEKEFANEKEQNKLLKKELEKQTKERDELILRLEENNRGQDKLPEELEQLNNENVHLRMLRQEARETEANLVDELKQLTEEKDELALKLTKKDSDTELTEKINNLERELEQLNRENVQLRNLEQESRAKLCEELKKLTKEKDELALQLKEKVSDSNKITVLIEKVNNLESTEAELRQELEQLRNLEQESRASEAKLKEELEKLMKEKDELALKLTKKDSDTELTGKLHQELEQLSKENDQLRNSRASEAKLREELETLTKEKDDLALKLKEKGSDSNKVTELTEKIKNLESTEAELRQELEQLRNLEQESRASEAKLREKVEKLMKEKDSETELTEKLHQELEQLSKENDQLRNSRASEAKLQEELEKLTKEKDDLSLKLKEKGSDSNKVTELTEKLNYLEKTEAELRQELEQLRNLEQESRAREAKLREELENLALKLREKDNLSLQLQENEESRAKLQKNILELTDKLHVLEQELEHSKSTEKQFAEKSSEEIVKLVEENKQLSSLNTKIQEDLDAILLVRSQALPMETQTDGDFMPTNEMEEQIVLLKRENGELLREMNEMNQALKERGESISNLESHCEEILKKLQVYETQANKNVDNITQKDETIRKLTKDLDDNNEIITNLRTELETLKNGNVDSSYAESETMSTSTISRSDEINRLKDLEGSWEERYGKLRNLAVKLKAKIRELTNTLTKEQQEKEDLQKKLSQNIKTIQTLQTQCDKLEDDLEAAKKQANQYASRLNTIAEDISKDKKQLVNNDDIITKLKQDLEAAKAEKQSTENWKKQVSAKIQTLRKELEANNVLKKDFEAKIAKLTSDLEAKEQQLKAEIENHKQTKILLEQSNNECKKNSVLNLEMQDYERSVKDLSQKIDKKQEHITKLKSQVESQKTTINALREQNKLLEEKLQNEETTITSASTEITSYKKKITELDNLVQQKEEKIRSITDLLESSRSENEELSTELSKVIAEHQKAVNALKTEKDHLRSQVLGLQQTLRVTQESLTLKEDELRGITSDYEGYKVRAQSVLRQNQNRDVGLEEKLTEEVNSLKSIKETLNNDIKTLQETTKDLQTKLEKLTTEKDEIYRKYQESEVEVEELKTQFAQLSTKHQKSLSEHAETVRSLKVHADTLSQCYRQQLSEQETRHNREIIELQSKLEKAPTPNEPLPPLPPSMPREEGEGSESIESNTPNSIQQPVPLERLLGSDMDHELPKMRKQLNDLESKVVYLTALLSDTEQDLAKHVQMNKMLKEEIRRQQRSVEREKHAENLEYLKNVVFKFVTLNSGDERSRLVPVLNTILKLSPEETNKLGQVARGDPGLRGWTNYLPTWSSPTKPQ